MELQQEAREWIEQKGGELTVKVTNIKVCCAPGVQELLAIPGKPKDIQRYHTYEIENLTIYVHKQIAVKETLHLQLTGFSLFKSISAKVIYEKMDATYK